MAATPGTRLGPFEIVGPLGAGGMGEVHRARDSRLGRDVAIKLIPDAFAADPERLARFEREARLLASLQHANIAVLHGLEEADGRRFLVMECVEGESLAQRLMRGPLPLGEALEVVRAIAAALEAAHEGGIVHRDLKPGNVMLTPAGDVKVLDFGLAKGGAAGSGSAPDLSESPTLTQAGTMAGVILGTAAYMSPEQARGKVVDRRTDIWSFGCVLFECLTGRQAFAGETVSDIVARILQGEPEWSTLPAATPERLLLLLHRCLEKDARRRLRDIGEARIEIEDLIAAHSATSGVRPTPAAPAAAPAPRVPTWALLALVAAASAGATWLVPRGLAPAPAPAVERFEILAPKGHMLPEDAIVVSISPDGRTLALCAADSSGIASIWIRRLDSIAPRKLAGTEGARDVIWSPDGRTLAYFLNDEWLMKVPLEGGTPERICEIKTGRGGDWNRDGMIVLAPFSNGGIFGVSADGGTPVQLTFPDTAHGVTGHRFPAFLPDGKHFLYATVPYGSDGLMSVRVGSIDDKRPGREVARSESGVRYAPPGWLLTTRSGQLVARRFDPRARESKGEPVPLGDRPVGTSFIGRPWFTISSTGTLAFLTPAARASRLAWVDFQGREIGAPPSVPGNYFLVRLSPDDRRALVMKEASSSTYELLLVDLERGVTSRLSRPNENASTPAWSPDGSRVAYIDETTESVQVLTLADGSRRALLTNDRAFKRVADWTPDGRALIYMQLDAATKWDVWLLPLEGEAAPEPLVRSPANDQAAQISPDGRWLACTSDESGVAEVYVRPFRSPGTRYQVTNGGGVGAFAPLGRRYLWVNAREPGVVWQAPIGPGPEFSLGAHSVAGRVSPDVVSFDLRHDERHWLCILPAQAPQARTATMVQNWAPALRGR